MKPGERKIGAIVALDWNKSNGGKNAD